MLLTVLIAVAVGGALLLGRRWSEMPAPSAPPPAPPRSPAPIPSPPRRQPEAQASDDWFDDEDEGGAARDPTSPEEIPDRMPIDHPLLVRAATQAIEGGAGSRYFTLEGDVLYFNLAALADPLERARACAILLSLHEAPGAGPAGVADVMWLLRRIASG